MEVHIQSGTIYDQHVHRNWGQSITMSYDMDLYGPVSNVNYLQFWQYIADTCSMYIDCLRIRKETPLHAEPVSSIGDHYVLNPAESDIVGYSITFQIISALVIILLIDYIYRGKMRKISLG